MLRRYVVLITASYMDRHKTLLITSVHIGKAAHTVASFVEHVSVNHFRVSKLLYTSFVKDFIGFGKTGHKMMITTITISTIFSLHLIVDSRRSLDLSFCILAASIVR